MRMRMTTAILWLAGAQALLAQQAVQEDTVTAIPFEGSAITWLIGAGFIIGALVVAFKPAKRSNLQ